MLLLVFLLEVPESKWLIICDSSALVRRSVSKLSVRASKWNTLFAENFKRVSVSEVKEISSIDLTRGFVFEACRLSQRK